MTAFEILTLVVSGLALTVAGWAAVTSAATTRRGNAIQERLLALEHARERDRIRDAAQAALRVSLEPGTQRGAKKLVVRNDGRGTARRISTKIDGTSVIDSDLVLTKQEVTVLGPGATAEYTVPISFQKAGRNHLVSVEWEDESGEPGRFETEIHIG